VRQIPLIAIFEDGSVPASGSPLFAYAQQVALQQNSDAELAISAFGANGAVYDLTGMTVTFAARARPTQAVPDLLISGTVQSPGTNGAATVIIAAAQINALTVKSYGYVILFKDSGGDIWPAIPQGLFSITPTDLYTGDA
jgi:hypothetical protein